MKKLILLFLFSPSCLWALSTTPQVVISTPANNSIVSGDFLTISGTAADPDGIVEVSMALDGNGFSTFANQPGIWKTIMTPSSLLNGIHVISVRVHNRSGYETTASVSVIVSNPIVPPVDPPPVPIPLVISLDQAIADPKTSTTTAQVYIELKKWMAK